MPLVPEQLTQCLEAAVRELPTDSLTKHRNAKHWPKHSNMSPLPQNAR
jgi:hypothetical protein